MAANSQSSPISNFIDYFTSVKPYHSKILEVVQKYNFYDDIVVNVDDVVSRQLSWANDPLCQGVGFGYSWDDCCGFDASECCSLGNCATDGSNFTNLTSAYSYPIQSIYALGGEVFISGDHSYDKTIAIKKVFSAKTVSVSGDITDYLGRESTFEIIPKDTIKFTINGLNTITVAGDFTAQFIADGRFAVYGTGYNDGIYTVISATYNKSANTTQVATVERMVSNKPGTILLKTSTKNNGVYSVTNFVYNGTDTIITVDTTVKGLVLEEASSSIAFKTGYVQNRIVKINGSTNNDNLWEISYSEYNPTTDSTKIILKNSLRDGTTLGNIDLMIRLVPADFAADTACKGPKEANVSVNFSELLVIRGGYAPSPTPTSTVTPTPTITPTQTASSTLTPTPTATATVTRTVTPTPSISISASPTPSPTPTPTRTRAPTPTPSPSSAPLSAGLSTGSVSGNASATCGPQTVYTNAVTAIQSGGCTNGYAFAWQFINGDSSIVPINGSAQATGFQKNTPNDGTTYQANYHCLVVDACGNQVYTGAVLVSIRNGMGSCIPLGFAVKDCDPQSSLYGQMSNPTSLISACTAGQGCVYPGSPYGLNPTTGRPQLYNTNYKGIYLPASRLPQYCDGNTWTNTPGLVLSGGSGVYSVTISNVRFACFRLVDSNTVPAHIGIMVGGTSKATADDSMVLSHQPDGSWPSNKGVLNVPYNPAFGAYGPIFVMVSNENFPSYQMKLEADVLISDSAGATILLNLEIPMDRGADNSLGNYQC